MTLETAVYNALKTICPRVYPDVAPTTTTKPYVTYQQIGGGVINPLNGDDPQKEGATFQINVWSATRSEAKALIRLIEKALRPAPLSARPQSAPFNDYDYDMQVYGSQQEFTLWY